MSKEQRSEKRAQIEKELAEMFEAMNEEEAENALRVVRGAVLGYAAGRLEAKPA